MTIGDQVRTLRKNMGYYMMWWLLFGALAGFLQYIPGPDVGGDSFWNLRFQNALGGMVFGTACGLAFTFFQNKYNSVRKKSSTWGIAIATWMGMKFVFYAAFTL